MIHLVFSNDFQLFFCCFFAWSDSVDQLLVRSNSTDLVLELDHVVRNWFLLKLALFEHSEISESNLIQKKTTEFWILRTICFPSGLSAVNRHTHISRWTWLMDISTRNVKINAFVYFVKFFVQFHYLFIKLTHLFIYLTMSFTQHTQLASQENVGKKASSTDTTRDDEASLTLSYDNRNEIINNLNKSSQLLLQPNIADQERVNQAALNDKLVQILMNLPVYLTKSTEKTLLDLNDENEGKYIPWFISKTVCLFKWNYA